MVYLVERCLVFKVRPSDISKVSSSCESRDSLTCESVLIFPGNSLLYDITDVESHSQDCSTSFFRGFDKDRYFQECTKTNNKHSYQTRPVRRNTTKRNPVFHTETGTRTGVGTRKKPKDLSVCESE